MNSMNTQSWFSLSRLSNILTIGVVIIAFALSFGALRDLADEVGIVYPALYPIMIDAGLVIYNIMALQSSLNGERNRYAWFLIVMATLASVFLNVVHSLEELPAWLAVILPPAMAAIPPLVIFGAFHLVVLRIEENAKRTRVVKTLTELKTAVADKTAELNKLKTEGQKALATLRSEMENERDRLMTELTDLSQKRDTVQSELDSMRGQQSAILSPISEIEHDLELDTLPPKSINGTSAQTGAKPQSLEVNANRKAFNLKERRQKVRQMLTDGMDKKEIAKVLGVHVRTVGRDISALEKMVVDDKETT